MAQQQKIITIMIILMITMATRYEGVTAQFFGCASLITTSMPDCSSFLAGTSLTASVGCCTEFESVMKSQAQCSCQVFNDAASFPGLSSLAKNTVAYAKNSNEKAKGIVAYLVEAASDEPLSVDGTVFVSVPLPEGFPEEGVDEGV
nr:non-specific lipid-transfer protein-like protein At2g13820 [Tanacetum cinerariifolium]